MQRDVLLKALAFYEEFAEEKSSDPEVRLETARAARRVGDIQHRLGDVARAATAYEQALTRLEQLRQDSPNLPGCRDELAQVHNNRGNLFRDTGQLADAAREYRDAQALFADLKSSTELIHELDPEGARRIIDPALRTMVDAVRQYDGYVVHAAA